MPWGLGFVDAREGVFDGRALAAARPPRGLLLRRAERLQQGFLRMNRDGAPARVAVVQAARSAQGWQVAAGKWTVVRPQEIGAVCAAGQMTRPSASWMRNACFGKRPPLGLVHAFARIATPCAWSVPMRGLPR